MEQPKRATRARKRGHDDLSLKCKGPDVLLLAKAELKTKFSSKNIIRFLCSLDILVRKELFL